jgi:hypothetical protein
MPAGGLHQHAGAAGAAGGLRVVTALAAFPVRAPREMPGPAPHSPQAPRAGAAGVTTRTRHCFPHRLEPSLERVRGGRQPRILVVEDRPGPRRGVNGGPGRSRTGVRRLLRHIRRPLIHQVTTLVEPDRPGRAPLAVDGGGAGASGDFDNPSRSKTRSTTFSAVSRVVRRRRRSATRCRSHCTLRRAGRFSRTVRRRSWRSRSLSAAASHQR